MPSSITRRSVLGALATSPFWLQQGARAAATSLKISHQFPSGNLAEGDFRDRLCHQFAASVERRTRGTVDAKAAYDRSMLAGAPRVQVLPVHDARHFLMFDQPHQVNAMLRTFLQAL